VPVSDHRDSFTERQGSRSRRRIRRNGVADSFRAARLGDDAVESDDDLDDRVYVDVDFAIDHRHEERGCGQWRSAGTAPCADFGSGCAKTGSAEKIIAIFAGFAEVAELADALA
jgi:hypothetical protein